MPSFTIVSIGVPAMIDWPTIVCCQPAMRPCASSADLDGVDVHRPVEAARRCRPRASRTAAAPARAPSIALATLTAATVKSLPGVGAPAEAAARDSVCSLTFSSAGPPPWRRACGRRSGTGGRSRSRACRRAARRRSSSAPSARGRGTGTRRPPRRVLPRPPAPASPSACATACPAAPLARGMPRAARRCRAASARRLVPLHLERRAGPASPPRCRSATTATPSGTCDDVDDALHRLRSPRRRTTSPSRRSAAAGRSPRSACRAA